MQVEIKPLPVPWGKSILYSLGISILCGLLLLSFFFLGPEGPDPGEGEGCILFGLITFSFLIGVGCLQLFRQIGGQFSGVLALEPDLIRWRPKRGQVVEISYGALWFASLTGRSPSGSLTLQAQQKELAISFKKQSLASPDLAEPFLKEVLERVENLPEGPQLRARIESRRSLAQQQDSKSNPVTLGIAGILVLVFLVEAGFGALQDPARMLALGANAPDLVAKGEVFRLATSTLLHGGPFHLLFNLLALLGLGTFLERLFGKSFFLTLFLASALAGAALSSLLGRHEMSVGASTGICGLIAAETILSWRWPGQLLTPPAKRRWAELIGLLFMVLVAGGKRVDHLGHLGGLIAGCLLMIPMLREADLMKMHLRHQKIFRWTSILLVVFFLVACAMIPLFWPHTR